VGGRVRGRTLAAVDGWAARLLHDKYVDVAFVGADGVSVETYDSGHGRGGSQARHDRGGPANSCPRRPHQSGNDQSACFANLDAVDVVITDSGLDETTAGKLGAAGPRVVRA
jgi:DeoR family transcriptional regulator, fructose operon transcriptional repressor